MSASINHYHITLSTQPSQQKTEESPAQLWDRAQTPLHSNQCEFRTMLADCQVRAYVRTVLLSEEYQANPQQYIADWKARNPQNYPQCCALDFFSNDRIAIKVRSQRKFS